MPHVDDVVPMPSLEEFENSGPVIQFMTKLLAQMVTRMQAMEHKIECLEHGGCAWAPSEGSPDIDQQEAERPRFGMPTGE